MVCDGGRVRASDGLVALTAGRFRPTWLVHADKFVVTPLIVWFVGWLDSLSEIIASYFDLCALTVIRGIVTPVIAEP